MKNCSLEETIQTVFGKTARVIKRERIHGGDINEANRVFLSTGDSLFVKTNSIDNAEFFRTEAAGLAALASSGEIGVPRVFGMGTDMEGGFSYLALEYLDSSRRGSSYWEDFGHRLAMLHRADCSAFVPDGESGMKYGFTEDNYIGASPQKNIPGRKWADFYRDCRLLPQIKMAERYFDSGLLKKADYLLDHLDSRLREPEFPSLLHGDLWGGNVMCGPDGRAWLIDPAVYAGDFEADLAMTQLFGGFPAAFYAAYHEVNPIDRKGYSERRALYHLYQLLNHLNLFGTAYLGSVEEILRSM